MNFNGIFEQDMIGITTLSFYKVALKIYRNVLNKSLKTFTKSEERVKVIDSILSEQDKDAEFVDQLVS